MMHNLFWVGGGVVLSLKDQVCQLGLLIELSLVLEVQLAPVASVG